MPEATFWFSSPFRDWIGQRTVTVHWEGRLTLREVLHRLAAEHPGFRLQVFRCGLTQDAFNNLAAVVMNGDFLALDSVIPDKATVDVFTPLAGGTGRPATVPRHHRPCSLSRLRLPVLDPRMDSARLENAWQSAPDRDSRHGKWSEARRW